MAIAVVTDDNTRIEDCEAYTGWANYNGSGAGGASEPSFPYQGSNACNRKVVSSTGGGIGYTYTSDGGSAFTMTGGATQRTFMAKVFVSDWKGLDVTDGVVVFAGSSSANNYAFVVAGTDSPAAAFADYGAKGGYLIIPIDPNENVAYSDGTKSSGTPNLAAMNFFAINGAFSTASAKSENVAIDALDIGVGLYLVGGDGVSADGTYADFVLYDEGTDTNRFGYASTLKGGAVAAFGKWKIGENVGGTSITEFTDDESIVYWLDHLAAAGFSGVEVNLGTAGTIVNDGATHIGSGDTTNVDSRPDYVVTGAVATAPGTFSHNLRNFRNITYTSICDVDDADIECALLTQDSADIANSIIRTNQVTSVACLQDPIFGTTTDLHDCVFVQTGVGHAIELATVGGSYTLTNLTFVGYGADTTDSAALDITAATGTTTISLAGTPQPTFKTAGATVSFVVSYNFTVTDIIAGSEVRIFRDSDGVELAGVESSGTSFVYSHPGGDVAVTLRIISLTHKIRNIAIILPDEASAEPANQQPDPDYINP